MMGHNSIPEELAKAAKEAKSGLTAVKSGETKTLKGWLTYGAALLKGKHLTEDENCGIEGQNPNARFGAWKVSAKLAETHSHDEAAAIWGAEHPDDLSTMQEEYPSVRTLRGLHDKWKEANKPKPKPKPKRKTLPLDTKVAGAIAQSKEGLSYDDIHAMFKDEAGKNPSNTIRQCLSRMVDASTVNINQGVYTDPGHSLTVDDLNKTNKQKYEVLERKLTRQFEAEVEKAVHARLQNSIAASYKLTRNRLDEISKNLTNLTEGNSIKISPAEYKAMSKVLKGAARGAQVSEGVARLALEAFEKMDIEPRTEEQQKMLEAFQQEYGDQAA